MLLKKEIRKRRRRPKKNMKKCKRDSRPVRLREKLHRKKLRNSHAPWMQGGGRGGRGGGARESCEGEGWEVAGGWGRWAGGRGERERGKMPLILPS